MHISVRASLFDVDLPYVFFSSDATYEIIIVDDGSRETDPNDKTGEVALQYVQKYGSDTVRLLTLHRNNGKGGAVQKVELDTRTRGRWSIDFSHHCIFVSHTLSIMVRRECCVLGESTF